MEHLAQIKYFKEIDLLIEDTIRNIGDIYISENMKEIHQSIYKFKVFYLYGKSLRSSKIDFTGIHSTKIIEQVSQYFRINYNQMNARNHLHEIQRIILTIKELEQHYTLDCISSIKIDYLEFLLHRWQFEYSFKPSTLSARISSLSNVFHFFISRSKKYPNITTNPCRNIRLFNKEGHIVSTDNIPADVIYQLDQRISELGQKYYLLYHLLRRTGCRFSEISLLKTNDFRIENDKWGQLKITPYKIVKSLKRNGHQEYRFITVPASLVNELMKYVENTASERSHYKIDYVFYGICRNRVSTVTSGRFNLLINRLIDRYNIRGSDGDLWRFSAKQLRKTFAVDLINNDVPLHVVQHALGHLHQDTTAHYYAQVEMMRISELNHEFFTKMFNAHFQECNFIRYTEDERRLLYVDFCMNKRNVEVGYCTKHPSEGNCKSIYKASCSTCPKLCTGVKFLPIWEERVQEKSRYLKDLEKLYQQKNISQCTYSSFPEYSKTFQSLQWDKEVIEKIHSIEEN